MIINSKAMTEFDPQVVVSKSAVRVSEHGSTSFKALKRQKQEMKAGQEVKKEHLLDQEMKEEIEQQYDPMFYDNVMRNLIQKVVVVGNGQLEDFPRISNQGGNLSFDAYQQGGVRDIFDVLKSRMEFH